VITTVSSKNTATAVVIKAVVDTRPEISSQSDQLLVTTGVATQAGFDLSATKYNLNSKITGDSSVITVRIVDTNGNPVADGVPVVFTTDYGAVGTSSRGGCTTINGSCAVTYSVQNPRPPDGGFALVTGSTQIGTGSAISDSLRLLISNPDLLNLYTAASGGTVQSTFTAPSNTCKFTLSAFAGTAGGLPAPADTTVSALGLTSGFSAIVKTGSPVLDRTTNRAPISFEFDATNVVPPCDPAGATPATATAEITFTSGTIVKKINVDIQYPR
ncbi:MAG: hypothetical protein ABIR35_07445, partial [Polaromonas sp.]